MICDILDPDVIVLGGGMSNVAELYDRVPPVVARYAFSDVFETPIVTARHGDSSGVRGAAWLWPLDMSSLCRDCYRPDEAAAPRCPAAARRASSATPNSTRLSIAHLDCDAFYASVEKRDRPELRDQPVIVGGGVRGVVTTCCYIARTVRRALGDADVQGPQALPARR